MSAASGNFRESKRSLRAGLCWVAVALILAGTPSFGAAEPGSGEPEVGERGASEQEARDQREKRLDKLLKSLEGLQIGTLSYFDYSLGNQGDGDGYNYNQFRITRGYINVKKQLVSWLGFRVTPDVHQNDDGDFAVRLKYLYGELRPPDLGFITDIKAEAGLGHIPWLDFEENLNPYRAQGTMFIERAGIFNSADVGVSIRGYLGGQLSGEFQEKVSHSYPGRWGSWHVGVYNGSGYHAKEANKNKVPEYRLSLRPLPDLLPGLQAHYFGVWGKGNTAGNPDYRVHLAMLSYQNQWVILTAQYLRTRGNAQGTLVFPSARQALRTEGYSFFANGKLPILDRSVSLFARYDHFDPDRENWVTAGAGDDAYDLAHAGVAWEFFHHWMILLVYERVMYDVNSGGVGAVPVAAANLEDDWRAQTVLQMEF